MVILMASANAETDTTYNECAEFYFKSRVMFMPKDIAANFTCNVFVKD